MRIISKQTRGKSAITEPTDAAEVSVTVDFQSLKAVKLAEKGESASVIFNVNVNLEEKERKSGRVAVQFTLLIGTKPSVMKIEVEGLATLVGKTSGIEQVLKADPKTKIPLLLHRIYQQVFKAIFLLTAIINVPNPPPDLLFSAAKGEVKTVEKKEASPKK